MLWVLIRSTLQIYLWRYKKYIYIVGMKKASYQELSETACNAPSHLDQHCLHRYLFWPRGLKGLSGMNTFSEELTL